ncbi:MAG: 30S ribosomal protein S15 [Candidatus Heimdallarchaeum aukensis]|uniref:Small ribosomal subunit protein uS15 n=1 Tax=Candidatus Heimdallarchaeum aukensis TaxID=2876573 RepID=A0A9Y1FJJ9_9ARCH|nr:MAG: 30S ribosomal protein S15 [Candidatus Heimdallarchaeum aukensis]
MARMHARTKGKAGSTRPYRNEAPDWLEYDKEFILKKIEELRRQGLPSAMIGVILRDQYGVPSVKEVLGKKLVKILEEKDLKPKYPEDLTALVRKAVNIRRHLEENPKDLHNRRGLMLVESKIRRLVKYYKRKGVFPPNFKYQPDKAGLLL